MLTLLCVFVSSDIDECAEGLIECHNHSRCVNLPGWYHCECRSGFHDNGSYLLDGRSCIGKHTNCIVNILITAWNISAWAHHLIALLIPPFLCSQAHELWILSLRGLLFRSLLSLVSYIITWLPFFVSFILFENLACTKTDAGLMLYSIWIYMCALICHPAGCQAHSVFSVSPFIIL